MNQTQYRSRLGIGSGCFFNEVLEKSGFADDSLHAGNGEVAAMRPDRRTSRQKVRTLSFKFALAVHGSGGDYVILHRVRSHSMFQ
jgi:hypothetical protein